MRINCTMLQSWGESGLGSSGPDFRVSQTTKKRGKTPLSRYRICLSVNLSLKPKLKGSKAYRSCCQQQWRCQGR